ncbi:MAG: S16 family serine protease, partial [Lentisphaeria bacterium]|nr:S16 family serine protease [Lentisphaeria bacterium]
LTGRDLPIGGVQEKILAAKRTKVKNVNLPQDNEKDFAEIPEKVRKGIAAHFVEDYAEVFALIFKDGAEG